MKRSNRIALMMMGTSALVLTACEEPKTETAIFETVEQCIAEQGLTAEQCYGEFDAAKAQHAEVSPKYASRADCEADFGSEGCEVSPYRTDAGGSVFMPLMAGFMMGQMMGGRAYTQPLYRSRDDSKNFRTANNRSVGAAVGRTQVSERAAARPAQKLYTQQRGGFGARARTTGFRAGA
ncbi:MAG: DUF1190 domain-containing protein [Alphaproteobacteria bacterium]|nr:DUF1190 domain-containing protein [Alphaproteobacteria bacterium]MCY4230811.1 DUF1190 domain-containing protein [Alphaproteobacteria bacterium]MCY4319804.1 DUF1190 domain-containing protein [Alphaproteobacteria bacterium]